MSNRQMILTVLLSFLTMNKEEIDGPTTPSFRVLITLKKVRS